MKDKKTTTEEATPAVVKTQENTNSVENKNTEVGVAEGVNSEIAKPEENIGDQNPGTESRVMGIKVITDEEIEEIEASVLEPFNFIAESGEEFQITTPKFRFKGEEYDSQKVIDETPEVLETLIAAKAFFIKKV